MADIREIGTDELTSMGIDSSPDMKGAVLDGAMESEEIKTATSGDLKVDKAGSYCYDNKCKSAGGCASCLELIVYLPLGATIQNIRYYCTAGAPNDTGMRQVSPGDIAWSAMDQATRTTSPTNTIVRTTYHNRSHNRDRYARLEVDWTP